MKQFSLSKTSAWILICCCVAGEVSSAEMTSRKRGLSDVTGTYPTSSSDPISGPATYLTLDAEGKFTLTVFCFHGDVGNQGSLRGTYVFDGRWIHMTTMAQSGANCGETKKIFVIRQNGNPMLFGDAYLANIASRLNTEHPVDPIRPLRRDGKQLPYAADPRTWLPEPYANYLKIRPIKGEVVSVGPTTTFEILAPGMPKSVQAPLTLDIGERDGVFENMSICSPGGRPFFIQSVQEKQSTVKWTWDEKKGSPAQAGMKVTSQCPR